MAKKRYYKRKHGKKGVRYIAKSLNKYFKGKYPTYTSALPQARKINADLKSKREKVILKNITPYVRKSRKKFKKDHSGKFEITDALLVPTYYWCLADYPQWIALCSNNIVFHSEISPAQMPPIQGGTLPSESYFTDYISFCNNEKGKAAAEENEDAYTTEWMVMCTEPVPDKDGTFKSKIISVDSEGNPIDYGFNPNDPDFRPDELVMSDAEPAEKPAYLAEKEEIPPVDKKAGVDHKTQADVDFITKQEEIKRHEVALKRQENIAMFGKMYSDGDITLSEFKSFVRDL
jgi:hypothetical protein